MIFAFDVLQQMPQSAAVIVISPRHYGYFFKKGLAGSSIINQDVTTIRSDFFNKP